MSARLSPGLRMFLAVLSVIGCLAAFLVPASAAGPAGRSLNLDGSDDEARGGAIGGTADAQTIEAWVRPVRAGFSIFLVNSDDVTGWLIETDDQGYAKFWAADSGGTWRAASNWRVRVQPGAWHHVAAVYDGARTQVYVDGLGGGWHDLGRMSQGPFFRLGGLRPYPFFAGQLDEVRISSGLRYGGDFVPPAATFSPDARTLALYHLDEGAGQTIQDSSGRGHHLTLGTMPSGEAADPTWADSTAPVSGGEPPAPEPATPTPMPTAPPATATPTPPAPATATPTLTPTPPATATATRTSTPTRTLTSTTTATSPPPTRTPSPTASRTATAAPTTPAPSATASTTATATRTGTATSVVPLAPALTPTPWPTVFLLGS